MSDVLTIPAALLLIATLITIHEFGHFIVAKAFGVRVKVFSVGIGGRLVGFQWGDTDYRLSWFPFGGYVRMAGADPFMDSGGEDDDPRGSGAFMSKPAWQRLLIVLAGPAMNLLLPFVVFTGLKLAGEPQPRAEVGTVYAGTPAADAGVLPEDHIQSVNGKPVLSWYDVLEAVDSNEAPTVDLVVERGGATRTLSVAVPDREGEREPVLLGFGNATPDTTVVVDDPASPAGVAGVRSGDVIVTVNGAPVRNWNEVRRLSLAASGPTVVLGVRHADSTDAVADLTLRAAPDWKPVVQPADDTLWTTWGLATATLSVASFSETSAAAKAGINLGDRLLDVDGQPVRAWYDVVRGVAGAASGTGEALATRALTMTVRRDGVVMPFTVTPDAVRDLNALGRYRWRPLLGIGGGGDNVAAPLILRSYPLGQAFRLANREALTVAGFIIEQLGKMTTGEAPAQDNLGGPVEIFRQTRAAAKRGLHEWARHLGLFSISLGVINLLPIPVLDGGQLMMYLAEWVRGRPLPLLLRERAQQAGVILLVLLMLFVLVNDVHRAVVG